MSCSKPSGAAVSKPIALLQVLGNSKNQTAMNISLSSKANFSNQLSHVFTNTCISQVIMLHMQHSIMSTYLFTNMCISQVLQPSLHTCNIASCQTRQGPAALRSGLGVRNIGLMRLSSAQCLSRQLSSSGIIWSTTTRRI